MSVTGNSGVTDYVNTTTGEVDRVVAKDPWGAGVVMTGAVVTGDKLLLETGDYFLLQANGNILLEG
jgi:hypothetical protein